ncbi:DEAD/DEAH box helicase [bacterium]|nr:DEAD/DEAH box helicase [Candidatus Elulimicrobium humile]
MATCKLIIKDEVNIKFEGLSVETRRKIVNELKFDLPYARHMPAYKLGRWDGTKTFFGIGGTGYLAHLDTILPVIENAGYDIDIEDLRKTHDISFETITENYWSDKGKVWPKGHPDAGKPIVLRDYQYDVVNKFLENHQALQEVATGAGKTITTATLSHLCEVYGRTMVIVPNKSLVVQTEEDYKNLGLDVGVYFGDRKELNRTHTICTWQSLNILDKKSYDEETLTLAEFCDGVVAVIVDEVHQAKADVLTKLLTQNFKNCFIRWGLTGTIPKEKWEFQSILASIGPVINRVSAYDLQEKDVLAKLDIQILQTNDVEVFRSYQEEYTWLVTDDNRLNWLSTYIKKISETGNTLVLVNRIDTGNKLLKNISDAVFISGEVKLSERKEEYDEIKTSDGKIIVATYGVAAVGINIPRIFNLVLLEPGKSFVRVIQSIGRGIRRAEDKDFVQIWDITSTCKYAKRHLTERKKFYKEAKYPFTLEKINWN